VRLRLSILAVALLATAIALAYTLGPLHNLKLFPSPYDPSYTGYDGPVLIGTDDRTLTIDGPAQECGTSLVAVATESPHSVAIGIKQIPIRPPLPACMASVNDSVQLSHPLGARTLVDRDGGAHLTSFDANRLLHPALPAGYHLRDVSPTASGAYQEWDSTNSAKLTLLQTDRPLTSVLLPRDGHYQSNPPLLVRGHPATQFTGSNTIAWTENGETMAMTWVTPAPEPSTAAVIAIADSSP
jgi:hypothetical protein